MIGFQEFKLFVFFERRFCVLNPKEDFCLEWKDKILGHEVKAVESEKTNLLFYVYGISIADCGYRWKQAIRLKIMSIPGADPEFSERGLG